MKRYFVLLDTLFCCCYSLSLSFSLSLCNAQKMWVSIKSFFFKICAQALYFQFLKWIPAHSKPIPDRINNSTANLWIHKNFDFAAIPSTLRHVATNKVIQIQLDNKMKEKKKTRNQDVDSIIILLLMLVNIDSLNKSSEIRITFNIFIGC